MKKEMYLAPAVDVFGVAVEEGFAASVPLSSTKSFNASDNFDNVSESSWDFN